MEKNLSCYKVVSFVAQSGSRRFYVYKNLYHFGYLFCLTYIFLSRDVKTSVWKKGLCRVGWLFTFFLFFHFLSSYKKALCSCHFFPLWFLSYYYASICINMTTNHSAKALTEMIQAKKQQDNQVTKLDNSCTSSGPWSTLLSSFISTTKDAASSSKWVNMHHRSWMKLTVLLLLQTGQIPLLELHHSSKKTAVRRPLPCANKGVIESKTNWVSVYTIRLCSATEGKFNITYLILQFNITYYPS